MRDAREDWRSYDAGKIPSKAATSQLDGFLAEVQSTATPRYSGRSKSARTSSKVAS